MTAFKDSVASESRGSDEPSPLEQADQRLRSFFQAELPHPWPVCRKPESSRPVVSRGRWGMDRSRGALAASVIVLILGILAISELAWKERVQPRDSSLPAGAERLDRHGRPLRPAPKPAVPPMPDETPLEEDPGLLSLEPPVGR